MIPIALQLSPRQQNRQQNTIYLPSHVKIGANGIFYYRFVYPEPLRALTGKRELKRSLGKDYGQMQQTAWQLNACITLLVQSWNEVRRAMADDSDNSKKIEALKANILNHLLQARGNTDSKFAFMSSYMTAQSVKSLSLNVQSLLSTLIADAKPEDMRNAGLTPEYLQGVIQQMDTVKPGLTLNQLLDKWIEDKQGAKKSDKTINAYNTAKSELLWAFGSRKEAASLTVSDLQEYKQFWRGDVPMLEYRKEKKLKLKSIISGDYDKPTEYLQDKSKANKLLNIRGFFRWAYVNHHLSTNFADLLRDMGFQDSINVVPSMPDEMISKLYELIEPYKERDGSQKDGRYKYWVFLLMLYTGARAGEVCQLATSDILLPGAPDPSDLNGLRKLAMPCIRFCKRSANKQSVKNESSQRVIPIHSNLIKRGFLDYVIERKNNNKKMLFDVTYTRGNGWAGKVSEFYNERIRKHFPAAKATLESTRHNVETIFDLLPSNSQEAKIAARITGRKVVEHNQVRRRYVDIYTPEQMQPIIEMIRYSVLGDAPYTNERLTYK